MNEKNTLNLDDDLLKEIATRSESLGFAAEEMLLCPKCARKNPPNRLNCFYCAAELVVPSDKLLQAKFNFRRLESWEKGFNVIKIGQGNSSVHIDRQAAAREVEFEVEVLEKILRSVSAVPLARVESEREADLLSTRLANHGIETKIVSDESFDLDRVPRRIRSVEFRDDLITVTDFNTGEITAIPPSDLVLIVSGTLIELKTVSMEKRKRKKSQIIDQSETSSDESVLDMYTSADRSGFRIYESGFDFSCLSDKSLLASENMPKLLRKIAEVCPNAVLDESYKGLQDALTTVWETDSSKDFQGLRRSGFGKADLSNVVTISNRSQFTRYSRLQRQLI